MDPSWMVTRFTPVKGAQKGMSTIVFEASICFRGELLKILEGSTTFYKLCSLIPSLADLDLH